MKEHWMILRWIFRQETQPAFRFVIAEYGPRFALCCFNRTGISNLRRHSTLSKSGIQFVARPRCHHRNNQDL